MANVKFFLTLIIASLFICGCSSSVEDRIMDLANSRRSDVFDEADGAQTAQPEYALLNVKASIKTHVEGYYVGELMDSYHGKAGYPFLASVDGQTVMWRAEGTHENRPLYGADGERLNDSDAGNGIRYTVSKTLRVIPGKHTLIIALPAESYLIEVGFDLRDGDYVIAEFTSVYRADGRRRQNYLNGLKEYTVRMASGRRYAR